jgi:beta-N-acetylhexosaminidase
MLKIVHDCTCTIPPLIAIDEEGGVVDRLGDHVGFIRVPSPADVQRDGIASARTQYKLLAKELVDTGFNLNLAPVVDLNINPDNPIIGLRDRSYSDDPETVIAFARAFIEAHRASGVLTSLKHFPGHGSSTVDSHSSIVDVGGTWSEKELLPYKYLIDANLVDTVMIGHLLNLKRWGGISSQEGTAIHDLLRKTLKYNGVTISDDLGMEGVGQNAESFAEVITSAVQTGIDIVLVAHPIDEDTGSYSNSSILAGLNSGVLSNDAIQSSFRHITNLKRKRTFGQ